MGTRVHWVQGHYVATNEFQLRSATLTTFASRLHEALASNMSKNMFPVISVKNISIYHISFVTNTLHEVKFSNHSYCGIGGMST